MSEHSRRNYLKAVGTAAYAGPVLVGTAAADSNNTANDHESDGNLEIYFTNNEQDDVIVEFRGVRGNIHSQLRTSASEGSVETAVGVEDEAISQEISPRSTSTSVNVPGGEEYDILVQSPDGEASRRSLYIPEGGIPEFWTIIVKKLPDDSLKIAGAIACDA